MIFNIIQTAIDVVFFLGLIVLAAAHFSGRTTGAELDVVRETLGYEIDKLRAEVDGGATPK